MSSSSTSPGAKGAVPSGASPNVNPKQQAVNGSANAAKPSGPAPSGNRPIQPLPTAAPQSSASASASLFDLGSMSNLTFGSLGSLGSLPSLGMAGEAGKLMGLQDQMSMGANPQQDNGRLMGPGAGTPSGARQAGPAARGTPPQAVRSGQQQPGGSPSSRNAPSNSGQPPLAPLQPHPNSSSPGGSSGPQPSQGPPSPSSASTAVVPASPSNQGDRRVINPVTVPNGQNFVDITEYLNMPQSEAAKKLSIPPSTLSKRWKEAVRNRKWPWRVVCKLDKEIMTLLHNVPQGAPIPEEIEGRLGYLMRKRQEELKPVVIRL